MTDMAHFAAYDEVGRIEFTISCPEDLGQANMAANGFTRFARIVWPVDRDEYYLPEGKLKLRPKSTVFLDGNMLRGVPAGVQVTIETQTYTADGTDIELGFEFPGVYLLKVDAFPQRVWTGEYVED